jgi:hypothetical protein
LSVANAYEEEAYAAFVKTYELLFNHIKHDVEGKQAPTLIGLFLALQAMLSSTETTLSSAGLNPDLLTATLSPDWVPKFVVRYHQTPPAVTTTPTPE